MSAEDAESGDLPEDAVVLKLNNYIHLDNKTTQMFSTYEPSDIFA
jgi:hypothetical protein